MARPDGNPHDGLVKFVFKDPAHAGPLLRSLLPERLVRSNDWSTLGRHDVTLIEPALRETRTDLVFTVDLSGQKTWIYVLFEHQSERDPWMGLRLLGYMTHLWEDQRRERGLPLSPIVPVVLYHGEKSWVEGTRLSDLFALCQPAFEPLREHCPDFRFLVDDPFARRTQNRRPGALLGAVAASISSRCSRARRRQCHVRRLPLSFSGRRKRTRTASDLSPGDRAHRGESYHDCSRTDRQGSRGARRRKGREGREEGRYLERRELLVKLITLRFGAPDAATLARLDGASAEQLSRCAERVLDATTLDEVLTPPGLSPEL